MPNGRCARLVGVVTYAAPAEGTRMTALVLASSTAGWLTAGVLGFLLWLMCLIFLGIRTIRRGHWVMFLIGIVLPIFWLIGAFMPRRR